MKTDYLIIGSGIAGLTFSLKIAQHYPERKVVIITKSEDAESNTKYAQGGVAIVMDHLNDSFEKHIKDTIKAGDGLCDPNIVEMVVKEGPQRFNELLKWGASFDKNDNGKYNLGKEGGHSANRILHRKDQTGKEIEEALIKQIGKQKNIELLDYHFAIDLLTSENRCYGCYVLNERTGQILTLRAGYTVLATGGIGKIYGLTTNPEISTGDGIAMAHRANAKTKDMEFIQFHPTAFYNPDSNETFLISEAVRGFGAYLKNKKGERFLFKADQRGELASRDIVSQAIYNELKSTEENCVYLDCTHLDKEEFIHHFPMIFEYCIKNDVNIESDWIPVIPVQHYLCGGIDVDSNGKTSIDHLYACGECSRTGLHGANRLASNSLLEALVFSDRIYKQITKSSVNKLTQTITAADLNPLEQCDLSDNYTNDLETEIQLCMREKVGIVRNNEELKQTLQQFKVWKKEIEQKFQQNTISSTLCEIRNMLDVAILITKASIKRAKNCGGFLKI
ncbi:L-aspartate oxidase [Flavobacterium sp. H122]|uniref:L-aspartate oxidase n=1 Tax=Flavobacterium sp. H122 TaxID=2529860 RepID=UPI0010AA0B65|nr:L-aspartate oxidase [Flavobacterium sp. H122]